MTTQKLTVEDFQIKKSLYTFEATVHYSETSDPGDYWTPPTYELTIDDVELDSEIYGFDIDTGDSFIINDDQKIKEIMDMVDWESELEKKL
jgi:hypothetical protein